MKKLSLLIVIIVISTVIYFYYGVSNISGLSVQQDSTNATRAFIYYQAKDTSLAVFAEYWEEGKEALIKKTPEVKKNQPLVLLGLHGDKEYNVHLVSNGKKTNLVKFTTESIPKSMLKNRWLEKLDEMPSGYILSQRYILRKRNPFGYAYMTDFSGETIWYQKVEGLPKISGFTKNGTVLVVSGNPQHERSAGNRLFEFDLLGRKILDIKLDSLKEPMEIHHDVSYTDDGNLIALTYDKREFKINGKLTGVKGDAIVRFDTAGNILWRWSVFDVEDPTKSNLKIDSLGEWGHANTLYQDLDGNYLLSFRDWNQIWKIDSQSGLVKWRMGDNGNVQLPEGFSFSGQHSIHMNKDGNFMMYDNGVKKKQSQILCFQVNEKDFQVILKAKIILPDKLYSQKRGSAYFINDERILVCAPESSTIAIIDLNGNILARASTGLPDFYRAVFVPSLY